MDIDWRAVVKPPKQEKEKNIEKITVREVSRILGVSSNTVQYMIRSGRYDWCLFLEGERGKRNTYYIFRRRFFAWLHGLR